MEVKGEGVEGSPLSFDASVRPLLDSKQGIAWSPGKCAAVYAHFSKVLRQRPEHPARPSIVTWRGSQVVEGARLESE